MAELRFMEDYHTFFDPKTYLEMLSNCFNGSDNQIGLMKFYHFFIKSYHDFWSKFESGLSIRHLEYGGGPSIISLVSASPKLDHTVFAEYTPANRQALKAWIAGSPEAHNWTPLVEFILCNFEDWKPPESVERSSRAEYLSLAIKERTDMVKMKIRSIVPCDITKVPIADLESYDMEKKFDVVSTSLCLEVCVTSEAQYKSCVAELCKFIKPNGFLFMSGVLQETFYYVGDEKFYAFSLQEKMVEDAMNEAGINVEKFEAQPLSQEYGGIDDCTAVFYVYGRKCE